MGFGGKPIALPRPGDPNVPGALYVARCRFGYGDTARTAGGASDGCHVWADTQAGNVGDTAGIPIFRIAAVSSDIMATASDNPWGKQYGGVMVWDIKSIVKTAFTAAVDLAVYDSDASDTTGSAWLMEGDIAATTVGAYQTTTQAADSGFGFWGQGPKLYNTTDEVDIFVESTGANIAAGIVDFYIVYSYVDMDPLPGTDWPDTLEG